MYLEIGSVIVIYVELRNNYKGFVTWLSDDKTLFEVELFDTKERFTIRSIEQEVSWDFVLPNKIVA
jgi:hypothetical protein